MILWKVKEREMDKTLVNVSTSSLSASNNNSLETYLNVELTSKCTCHSHLNFSTGKIVFFASHFYSEILIALLYCHAVFCFSGDNIVLRKSWPQIKGKLQKHTVHCQLVKLLTKVCDSSKIFQSLILKAFPHYTQLPAPFNRK